MDDEVLKLVGIIALTGLAVLIVFLSIAGARHLTMSEANAKPVTTEIPEYKMKCVKFGPNVCEEYTISRITRN